jgi:hypothetical protein
MASSSVSFRISRSAEDLAGTLHLLSQRLVLLEQRIEALEGERRSADQEDPALVESLGNAERLLLDCRALLGGALEDAPMPADVAPIAAQAPEDSARSRAGSWGGSSDPSEQDGLAQAVSLSAEEGDTAGEAFDLDDEEDLDTAAA